MTRRRFSKFLTIEIFFFALSIEATEISRSAGVSIDDSESKEFIITENNPEFTYQQNQPKVERKDEVNTYPHNVRYWFGKSKEWTNFQRPKQLKRSGGSTSRTLPFSSINKYVVDTNNSFPNCHYPINLLHGNNLTVKNYFLVIPRSNENFNDTLQRIASLGDENCEPKTIKKTNEEHTNFKHLKDEDTFSLNQSSTAEHSTVQTTQVLSDNNPKCEETLTKNIMDFLISESTVVLSNTSEAESTPISSSVKEEYSLSLFGDEDKTSTRVRGPAGESPSSLACETRSITPPAIPSNEVNEFLRTLDKYCETFNTHTTTGSPPATVHSVTQAALINNLISRDDQLKRLHRHLNMKPLEPNKK